MTKRYPSPIFCCLLAATLLSIQASASTLVSTPADAANPGSPSTPTNTDASRVATGQSKGASFAVANVSVYSVYNTAAKAVSRIPAVKYRSIFADRKTYSVLLAGASNYNTARPKKATADTDGDYKIDEGTFILQPAIGLLSFYYLGGYNTSVPPITVSGEYFIDENISLGGILGYSKYSYGGTLYDGATLTYFLFAARAAYTLYLESNPKFSYYGAAMLGYNSATVSSKYSSYTVSASGGVVGIAVGARYLFTPNIGAFAELGYSYTLLKIGASLKF